MGWASEQQIEIHNEMLATDYEYAEEYFRQEAEYQAWFEWREEQIEREIDWFSDIRIAHDGYSENDVQKTLMELIDDDIPF